MADDSYHVVNKQSRHREAEKRHREVSYYIINIQLVNKFFQRFFFLF